jgi:hypothetical protein
LKMIKRKSLLTLALAAAMTLISVGLGGVKASAAGDTTMLLDDYNRPSLGVEGKGGAYNTPNSKGIAIYWMQMSNAVAKIENNALKLQMDGNGWFGEGAALKDPTYKFIIIKVKGEKGGEEKTLSLNPDAKGGVKYTDLKGADGKPVPAITKEYQNIVIDIEKSGFKIPEGFEAMHFNNVDPITIYIDEIYISKDGKPTDFSSTSQTNNEQASTTQTAQQPSNEQTNTAQPVKEQVESKPASTAVVEKSSSSKGVLIGVIGGAAVLGIGGVIYVLYIRKPN